MDHKKILCVERTNPSFGGTTRNATFQKNYTHSIYKNRIHLRKAFNPILKLNDYPSCVEFETLIGFTKFGVLIF
jgi:hypothetical protein